MVINPSVPFWQPALGRLGECVTGLENVSQAISIITNTQLGSVPLQPEFDCDLISYIDKPINEAQGELIRSASIAIKRWEPRVDLQQIRVKRGEFGHFIFVIDWKLKNSTVLQTTVVTPKTHAYGLINPDAKQTQLNKRGAI